jgi:hypothetical protein
MPSFSRALIQTMRAVLDEVITKIRRNRQLRAGIAGRLSHA